MSLCTFNVAAIFIGAIATYGIQPYTMIENCDNLCFKSLPLSFFIRAISKNAKVVLTLKEKCQNTVKSKTADNNDTIDTVIVLCATKQSSTATLSLVFSHVIPIELRFKQQINCILLRIRI